jgi:hypothetical protein
MLGSSAIQLKRLLGHEYVNGFNPVIMRSFKCNHDIQIMIGGSEMAERMYYACKYTTKDQQKVECKIALALAGFERRICCDKESAAMGKPLSDEVICRRRLTSQLFHMTNKHETAGPLCALYILRQSCAYHSHVYKILPARQMLKQLLQHNHTLCELAVTFAKHHNTGDDEGESIRSGGSTTDDTADFCGVNDDDDDNDTDGR